MVARFVNHHLSLALLAAILLALFYGGAIVYADYGERRDHLTQEIVLAAQDYRKESEDYIQTYLGVLTGLSEVPCVVRRDNPTCSGLFEILNKRFPNAINFAAAGADGFFFATGKPFPGGKSPDISKRAFFTDLAGKGQPFHIMNPHTGPISGQKVTGMTVPLTDPSGAFAGLVGVSLDFRELEERWNAVKTTPDIGVMVFDSAGGLAHVNKVAAVLAPKEQPPDSAWRNKPDGITVLGGRQWHYHTEAIPQAGWSVVALHPAPYGMVEYLRDTSLVFHLAPPILALTVVGLWLAGRELNRLDSLEQAVGERTHELSVANAKLARSAQELETLAWVASHDLREPSRNVATYVSMLERRYGGLLDQDGLAYITFAREGAKRMNELVLALLDYLSIERTPAPPESTDTGLVVQSITAELQTRLVDQPFTVTCQGTLPVLNMSREHLRMLYAQLLENAVRHRHPDRTPEIVCGCDAARSTPEFWVCDNGKGIAPEFRQKVFVLFQRLHPDDVPIGTGVGLTLCQRIVERYGGTIWVTESTTGGCCFRFTLPDARLSAA